MLFLSLVNGRKEISPGNAEWKNEKDDLSMISRTAWLPPVMGREHHESPARGVNKYECAHVYLTKAAGRPILKT